MRYLCIVLLIALACATSTYAQQCLHGPNQDATQKARRQAGLTLVRAINTAEANDGMGKAGRYLPLALKESRDWQKHLRTMKALSDEGKSTRFIAARMKEQGLAISHNTVYRCLTQRRKTDAVVSAV
jgi:hypothetical protein